MTQETISYPGQVVGHETIRLDTVDSTNEFLKRRALQGAEDGLAATAEEQTGGKGRRGRSFQSLRGKGLYLSALLYPAAPPETLSQLTAWTAVAAARAVEQAAGLSPGVKWPNDLLTEGKKLCGILTEAGACPRGLYVIVGVGVNLAQTADDFGPELADKAVSLAQLGRQVTAQAMARALLAQLDAMYKAFPGDKTSYLADYRRRCVTLGKEVRVVTPTGAWPARALAVDDNFALVVRTETGETRTVSAGEVSVRGTLGYA